MLRDKGVSLLLHSVQGFHYLTCYTDSCMYLCNVISYFAYLGVNPFREHASGRQKANRDTSLTSPGNSQPPLSTKSQSSSSEDIATSYHHERGWGTGPGEHAAESVGLLPTGSHYCAALSQIHSRWVSSYGLASESLSNKNTSLFSLTIEASETSHKWNKSTRGLFCRACLVFCHKAKQMFVKSELVIQLF